MALPREPGMVRGRLNRDIIEAMDVEASSSEAGQDIVGEWETVRGRRSRVGVNAKGNRETGSSGMRPRGGETE